jgi:acetyl-CoA carboxylase biotin carboxyl carrier protein
VAKATGSHSKKVGTSEKKNQKASSDLQHLEKIFQLMEKHEVSELEWERKGERLKLKTKQAAPESLPTFPIHPSWMGSAAAGMPSGFSISEAQSHHKSVAFPASKNQEESLHSRASPAGAGVSQSASVGSHLKQVVSPFVGTFYRSSSPGAEFYVREGQSVKRGDVLCIIEAMKLMNEIEAEFPGKIISVLVENGQPVEFGEPLFIIEP